MRRRNGLLSDMLDAGASAVQGEGAMRLWRAVETLRVDASYRGLASSLLGRVTGLV